MKYEILAAALLGFWLDLLLGDPAWLPHPVIWIGKAISALEVLLRRLFPKTPTGERFAGALLAFLIPAGTFAFTFAFLSLCTRFSPVLRFLAETVWCAQALALKGLKQESMNVYRELTAGSLAGARTAVARIVGRDTAELTAEGVTKAAVETVAENFSDGVIAPLFWMLLGGAPFALTYKAINTLDSMVGYKNERYRYFGTCSAKLDDLANFLPARISALLLIAAAPAGGGERKRAWSIWRRDRRKHASPNSAQTESAVAGALGVQLAGPAFYFGQRVEKPTLGDPLRPIEPEDIRRANQMNLFAGLAGLLLFCALRLLLLRML